MLKKRRQGAPPDEVKESLWATFPGEAIASTSPRIWSPVSGYLFRVRISFTAAGNDTVTVAISKNGTIQEYLDFDPPDLGGVRQITPAPFIRADGDYVRARIYNAGGGGWKDLVVRLDLKDRS